MLFDDGRYETLDENIFPVDFLEFEDTQKYSRRLADSQARTGLSDAIQTARGTMGGIPVYVLSMEFGFMGGSVASVVGEKIARACERAIAERRPLIIVSCSGGMRMQEGMMSLMQMMKTSAAIALMGEAKVPFISVLADPTTGGTTASFAMLGDINIAEPQALIGFAGPQGHRTDHQGEAAQGVPALRIPPWPRHGRRHRRPEEAQGLPHPGAPPVPQQGPMTHEACLEYLKSLQRFGIKLGLDNIRTLLGSLGRPDRRFPSVLIAGTNGKGSVAAMLARILTEHGLRTGLYTSPHLVRVEERIRIGDELIPARSFARALTAVRESAEALVASGGLPHPPTFFEVLTATALVHFAEEAVDCAVLEVGMGGRFDATNAVTPLLSVITTVSLDHQKYLGGTLGEIAYEKAGIIKPGVPVVCGVRRGVALQVIRRRARELRAPFIEVFGRGTAFAASKARGGARFAYDTGKARYEFEPSLPGFHQGENAAVAIRAAEVLDRVWRPLDPGKMIVAVGSTRWEGRLEAVVSKPRIILDGAHNPEGAASLAAYVRDVLGKPVILVFDAMMDKEIGTMAASLFPLARKVVLTRIPMGRAAGPEDVLRLWKGCRDNILIEPDIGKALKLAKGLAGAETPVLAAGSLFLVGEIKKRTARKG